MQKSININFDINKLPKQFNQYIMIIILLVYYYFY